MNWIVIALAVFVLLSVSVGYAAPAVSNLTAEYRDGQVFLSWDETPRLQGRLTVRMSNRPITMENVSQATVVADHLNPGSANDWWLNEETYGNPVKPNPATGQKPPTPHEGFILKSGGGRLNPNSGLHVHTVAEGEPAAAYYAVTTRDEAGAENLELVAGANSLAQPVSQQVAAVQPIWQMDGAPDLVAAQGKPMHLVLHAKTGRGTMEYLVFGDKSLGWREGLPFKFGVRVTGDYVMVTPTDRTWIGRMFPEGRDSCQKLTPAIHSFWYGYNDHIYDPAQMAQGTVVNYTERRLLWIIDWVKRTYQTDPNRTYAYGSSMGGCGDIAVCLRHPEIFSAIRAHVPIVAYDKGAGGDSEMRVVAETGGMDKLTSEGRTVRDRLDGTKFIREFKGDLPFLVITNGRQDSSIPWWKNPDFYRAMRDARQGMLAAWDEGEHGTCAKSMPADVKCFDNMRNFHKLFAINQSYLALSNSSLDNNPGDGDKLDGDPVGFMGRGFTWEPPLDDTDKYEVTIKWLLEAEKLPVTVDVTPRRIQNFRLKPGDKVTAANVDAEGKEVQRATLVADEAGLVTWRGFKLTSGEGNRMELRR